MHARLLVTSLLAGLGACSATLHLHSNWSTWSSFSSEPSTETKTLTIECAPEATTVLAKLRTDASGGTLTLRLVDPAGVERLRQVVERGRADLEQNLPAQVGTWSLRVDTEDLSGSWSVELSANDEPIQVHVEIAGDPPR